MGHTHKGRVVAISRMTGSLTFPAYLFLLAAMNTCPCVFTVRVQPALSWVFDALFLICEELGTIQLYDCQPS